MADLSLVYKPTSTVLDSITFDGTVRESYELDTDITDHPVEKGANVTDHSRPKPDMLTIDALFTDTPLSTEQNTRAVESGGFTFQTNDTDVFSGAGTAEASFQKLVALRNAGKVFTVTTVSRTYDNMMIQKITAPRDSKTGEGVTFTLVLKRIRQVTNKLVTVNTALPKGKGKKKLGAQPSTEAKPETKKKARTSILYDGAESLGDAFGNKNWFKPGG